MGRDRRNESRVERFSKWVIAETRLPAWKALTPWARVVYMEFVQQCITDGKYQNNNGQVYCSPRKLAERVGCDPKTASAAIADLQAKGWLVCTSPWKLGVEGKGTTAKFRLTMLPTGDGPTRQSATGEPKRWMEGQDFEVTVYATSKPKPRKGRSRNFKNAEPHAQLGSTTSP